MRRHLTTLIAGAAGTLLLTLTGCSSEAEPSVTKASVTPEPAATTTSPTATPTPSTFKIGEAAEVNDTGNGVRFTAAVLAYTQPHKGPQPPDPTTQGGDVWATAEVKVCNVEGKSIRVSQFPWSLAYADGTVVKVTGNTGGDLPKPEFPMDAAIKPGRCVKGKIPFAVMKNTRPALIIYAPESLTAEPVEWSVPKS